MESPVERIERLLNDKIFLFQELLDILKDEKKSIVDIDVDKLWAFSKKKQVVASKIEDIRKDILHVLDGAAIVHEMTLDTFSVAKIIELTGLNAHAPMNQLNVTLILLKKRVQAIAKENKKYVQDYLGVMDELIGTIADMGEKNSVYENTRYPRQHKKTSYMLNTEV